MRDGQQQREQEVHEHLNEQRAADHALGSPSFRSSPVALRVIGSVGQLLDGEYGRTGDDQHEAR